MKISQFIRESVSGNELIVIKGIDELAKEVNAIGRNLNQLAILCHQGKITCPNIDHIERKLDEIWHLLNSITAKTKRKNR